MLEVETYEAPELLGVLALFEISPDYCRETAAIKAASAEIPLGTVLMKNDDGTLSPWAPAAAAAALEEGEEKAAATTDPAPAGILLRAVAASSVNIEAPVLKRGALVSASMLKWPVDAEEKKPAALAALEALGIVAR